MSKLDLWEIVEELKSENYQWVDLTHELSPSTPHWFGFKPLKGKLLFDYLDDTPEEIKAPMRCFEYTVASQYGTHVDVPRHFHCDGRSMDKIDVKELVYPLVVIDRHKECEENPEFVMTVEEIQKWEAVNGKIPKGAFVAFRSDWYKKDDLENKDANGIPRYPGWSVEAIKWLVEQREIGAIGHEPADTDPSFVTTNEEAYPYPAEAYILEVDKIQIEVMRNLDKLPAVGAMIVCAFPKLKDGVGYPARCFAICPK